VVPVTEAVAVLTLEFACTIPVKMLVLAWPYQHKLTVLR
jgi:hypothetical protein